MVSKWRQLFLANELEQGKQLFEEKRVTGLISSATKCVANVRGPRGKFLVRIRDLNREYPNMQCTCPGSAARYCAHEAAVLMQWEKENGKEEQNITVSKIFPDDEAHRKLFFQLGADFRKADVTTQLYEEAKRFIDSGSLVLKTPMQFSYAGNEYVGKAQTIKAADGKRAYAPSFILDFTRNGISNWRCMDCGNSFERYSFYFRRGNIPVCSTCLAALILVDEYLLLHNPGDETNRMGSAFLSAFGHRNRVVEREEQDRKKIVQLVPRLKNDGERMELSFKVGVNKLYVLKDPEAFIKAALNKELFRLGKNNSIDFAAEDFTERSEKYFEILQKNQQSVHQFNALAGEEYYYYRNMFSVKKEIILQGDILDSFYDTAKGSVVEYSSDSGDFDVKKLLIDEVEPHISLALELAKDQEGDAIQGIALTGRLPDFMEGIGRTYMVQNGVFGPVRSEIMDRLAPLFHVEEFGDIYLQFGEKQIPEFYYRILPQLEEDPCIDMVYRDIAQIEELVPPEAKFSFWMDIENGKLLCRPKVSYEEKEFSLKPLEKKDLPLEYPRNETVETHVSDAVQEILPDYDASEEAYTVPVTDDRLFQFLSEDLDTFNGMGEVQGTDEFNRLKLRKQSTVHVGISVESDLLNLQITGDDISPEEFAEILESYRRAKKYHRLRSGEFISLDQEEGVATLARAMEEMNVDLDSFTEGKMHLPLYRALYINKLLEDHDEIAANRDATFRTLIRNFNSVKNMEVEVPAHLKGVLRNYQKYGFRWLYTLASAGFGGILADDMGLGKTLQTIAFLSARISEAGKEKEMTQGDTQENIQKKTQEKKKHLIVCPASLIYNWEEEFHRFAPEIKTLVMAGGAAARKKLLQNLPESVDVIITSYDLLKRDIDSYRKTEFDVQVIDEAQNIKNPTAAVSKAVKVVKSDIRFALTGTPIENRLSELWSIFDYLMPGFLFTYPQFRDELDNPITKEKDEEATLRLQKMVSPFILRRLKQQVLKDLPDKLEETRYARFDSTQQKFYDAQVLHMKNELKADDEISKIEILSELTKIRQICCDPHLLADNYKGDSAKLLACIDLVKSAMEGGHRILLFSQFTSMLEIIQNALEKEDIAYYKITGKTSKEERMRLVHAFNKGTTPVFLISLKAGGTGLNLTGADVVIHYDPWWNAAAQNQATDRAHRIGQTKEVTVYRLIVKNTIEEKILKLQETKKDLADAVLSGDQTSLSSLSTEELMELLE